MDVNCPSCSHEFDVFDKKWLEDVLEWGNNGDGEIIERIVVLCPYCHECLEVSRVIEVLDILAPKVEIL